MENVHAYVLSKMDLRGKTILDAAVGAAGATLLWAKAIHGQGGSSRILAVDKEFSGGWEDEIRQRLGDYGRYVDLIEADIFDLGFLEDGSIDVVNCADTIIFLNPTPLRLLAAFREFHRVLRPSGYLVIVSEIPVTDLSATANEGQWRRWNLAKAISALKGETWTCEPLAREVVLALEALDFEIRWEKTFPGGQRSQDVRDSMDEWKEAVARNIKALLWDDLRGPLMDAVDNVYEKVIADGYIMCPSEYVLVCVKEA